jgi:hypothetical protein
MPDVVVAAIARIADDAEIERLVAQSEGLEPGRKPYSARTSCATFLHGCESILFHYGARRLRLDRVAPRYLEQEGFRC